MEVAVSFLAALIERDEFPVQIAANELDNAPLYGQYGLIARADHWRFLNAPHTPYPLPLTLAPGERALIHTREWWPTQGALRATRARALSPRDAARFTPWLGPLILDRDAPATDALDECVIVIAHNVSEKPLLIQYDMAVAEVIFSTVARAELAPTTEPTDTHFVYNLPETPVAGIYQASFDDLSQPAITPEEFMDTAPPLDYPFDDDLFNF